MNLPKCFSYFDHHYWNRYHRRHHHRHHHQKPWPKCAHISPISERSKQQILLENLSWRPALPKIQLSTMSIESKTAIVNTMVVRDCEISSWWAHWWSDSDSVLYWHPAFGCPLPATCYLPYSSNHPPHPARQTPPASCLLWSGICNSRSRWV